MLTSHYAFREQEMKERKGHAARHDSRQGLLDGHSDVAGAATRFKKQQMDGPVGRPAQRVRLKMTYMSSTNTPWNRRTTCELCKEGPERSVGSPLALKR